MTTFAPPPAPPPPPPPPAPEPPRAPQQARTTWILRGLLAVFALAGGLLVWKAMPGGTRQMAEGTVTVPSFDDSVVDDHNATAPTDRENGDVPATDEADTSAPSDTDAATTAPASSAEPSTSATMATVAPTTVAPTTVAPTVAATVAPTVPATTVSPGGVVFTERCSSASFGWDVGVPQGWYAAQDTAGDWGCGAFDRAPVTITPDSEILAPITITFIESPISTVLASYESGTFAEVLSEAQLPVDIYNAWRLETRATADAAVDEGTLGITYLVDRGGWSTVVIDGLASGDADYLDIKRIVDALAGDIRFWDS